MEIEKDTTARGGVSRNSGEAQLPREMPELCLGQEDRQPVHYLPVHEVLPGGARQGRVIGLAEYRKDALRTFPVELLRQERRDYLAMKLVEESGEFMSLICKAHYQGEHLDQQRVTEELGDVLWALHVNLAEYGLSMEQIMAANMEKRAERYPAR